MHRVIQGTGKCAHVLDLVPRCASRVASASGATLDYLTDSIRDANTIAHRLYDLLSHATARQLPVRNATDAEAIQQSVVYTHTQAGAVTVHYYWDGVVCTSGDHLPAVVRNAATVDGVRFY